MPYSFQQGLLNMPPKVDPDRRLLLLPTEEIKTVKERLRKSMDRAALTELMISIAQVGLIEPLVVRKLPEGYELIAGERRLKACKLLGHREIPCVVITAGEERCAVLALSENLQRRPLHFLEEAERLKALLDASAYSEEQLSTVLGKADPYLASRLRLLKLPQETRTRLRTGGLSERHAKALLRISDAERQQQALDLIEQRKMSGPATERLVDSLTDTRGAAPMRILRFSRDCRLFVNSVKDCIGQLEGTGVTADLTETRRDDGVDLLIRVRT
ncbi:MAG: ParB/RepB/Spo0J family partition protein [Clostridia bacterium]|nr:ParB/RepB/Spo0J family partition protein [Clostridia bacterium]